MDDRVAGLPAPRPASGSENEVDDSGWEDELVIGGKVVRLSTLTHVSVRRPPPK